MSHYIHSSINSIILLITFLIIDSMDEDTAYISELENTIEKLLSPIHGIPFHITIKALAGKRVFQINLSESKDKKLVEKISQAAEIALKNANDEGIFRNRPNEVGNDIETFVKDALFEIGFSPDTPQRADGVRQATGYPDIYFMDDFNRHIYLECKTFNKANINTTQRAFYLSPSITGNSKIIYDAPHLILSFQIKQINRDGKRCYIPVAWKLVDIYSMKLDVKHEFNASNRDIYQENTILAEKTYEC